MTSHLSSTTFSADSRGNVAIIFGLCITSAALFVGAGVDIGRQQNARKLTADAVDSAVLAGARWLQTHQGDVTGAITAATAYYQANIQKRLALVNDTVTFVAGDQNQSIKATGSASIATTFLRVGGLATLPVITNSGATASLAGGGGNGTVLELSVMLDITGSMCDDTIGPCATGTKISALKTAAKDLVNIVVPANQPSSTTRIALVPFSTRIRVEQDGQGGAMMKKLTNLDAKASFWYNTCTDSSGGGGSEGSGDWECHAHSVTHQNNWLVMPCVTERFYNAGWSFDATDNTPGAGKWLNAHDGSRMPVSADSSNTQPTSGTGQNKNDPTDNWNYNPDGTCADIGNENQLLPLTSDRTKLISKIDGLTAYGGTAGALGTAMSWYTLSPNWATIWDASSAPGSYFDLTATQSNGAPKLRKVAVLMTDGGYDTYRSWKDQDQQQVSNYALSACTAMKAKGIEIYTIGFELDKLPVTQQPIALATLKACGTDIQHFYQTLTPADLQTAFNDIGLKLSNLRLTK
jgi:Flp pilus assembly protein TadG